MTVLTAVAALATLTLLLATLLVVANHRLHVDEDPRIDAVETMLPGTNCGACGQPGCRAFAESLIRGDSQPGGCTVSNPDQKSSIAAFLGVAVGGAEKRVARLACAGGSNVARNHARYVGLSSCRGATLISGGGKGCFWGCLGLGDCEVVCDFDAIRMNRHRLPIVDEAACTACGDCVEACPKDLFSLQPVSNRLWVNCKNEEFGDGILADCEVGCTACGRCAMDAPDGLITMRANLAVVDYTRDHATRVPIERCPTGAIVWLGKNGVEYGRESRRVIRESDRRDAPT